MTAPMRDPDGRERDDDQDGDDHRGPAGREPADARQRRGQEELEPPRRLVRCPDRHERRRGEPGEDHPELDEQQLQEPADRPDVEPGKDRAQQLDELGRLAELLDERPAGAGDREAEQRRCPGPTRSTTGGSGRTRGRSVRGGPTSARGRLGVGIGLVAPMSRRANASTPITSRTTVTSSDRHERRPVVRVGQRDVVRRPAQPAEVGQRRERRDRRLVAVDDEAAEHDRPGDAGRGAAADERRQGERDGTRREGEQGQPDRVARGRLRPRSRRRAGPLTVCADEHERQEDHERGDRQARRRAPNSFSSAMPAARQRGRGDELEAAAARLERRASPTGRGSTTGSRSAGRTSPYLYWR